LSAVSASWWRLDFDFAEAAPAEFRQGVDELGVVFLDG